MAATRWRCTRPMLRLPPRFGSWPTGIPGWAKSIAYGESSRSKDAAGLWRTAHRLRGHGAEITRPARPLDAQVRALNALPAYPVASMRRAVTARTRQCHCRAPPSKRYNHDTTRQRIVSLSRLDTVRSCPAANRCCPCPCPSASPQSRAHASDEGAPRQAAHG